MPTRHFLNALGSGIGPDSTPNRLSFPSKGVWSTQNEFLRNYADSVEVGGNLSIKGMAHSVPSADAGFTNIVATSGSAQPVYPVLYTWGVLPFEHESIVERKVDRETNSSFRSRFFWYVLYRSPPSLSECRFLMLITRRISYNWLAWS